MLASLLRRCAIATTVIHVGCTSGSGGVDAAPGEPADAAPLADAHEDVLPNDAAPHKLVLAAALGEAHTCALRVDGTVSCWGANESGQLGQGTLTDLSSPALVPGVARAVQIVLGTKHTCALTYEGEIMCWGQNVSGQLGDGTEITRSSPVSVPDLEGVKQLALGARHTCALLTDGTVSCWGDNLRGQLGDGTLFNTRSSPAPVVDLAGVVQIAAANHSTCALAGDGTVSCWGAILAESGTALERPTTIAGLGDVVQLAIGYEHMCAVHRDGSALCWGRNDWGQVGDGTEAFRDKPTTVSGLAYAWHVAAGTIHSCAVRSDGAVVSCWGSNSDGELGFAGSSPDRSATPVVVAGLPGLVASLGTMSSSDHTCVVLGGDEDVWCWGANAHGQLGRGYVGALDQAKPAPVAW